jgi:hypothetical protein
VCMCATTERLKGFNPIEGGFYLYNAVIESDLFDILEMNKKEVVKKQVACQQCFSRVKRAKQIDDSRATS